MKFDDISSRFDIIHERDRQTNGHLTTTLCIASW